jgi:hypothetical protein
VNCIRCNAGITLRAALRFYSDTNSWTVDAEDDTSVHQDVGQRARAALVALGEQPTCCLRADLAKAVVDAINEACAHRPTHR